MNEWKEIWLAYHSEATRTRVFIDVMSRATAWDYIYILFLLAVLAFSLAMHIKEPGWWLVLSVITEVALLFKLSNLKEMMILNEYGGPDKTKIPPSKNNHQDTRYLIFKSRLKEKHITKSHVKDCFDLIESQIDIASTDSTGLKKSIGFSIGMLAGVFTTIWKKVDTYTLILIAFSIIGFVIFIYLIASAFPSKLERLKEQKYFMLLFCREMS